MIREENQTYILETNNTTYCFRVMETGHLEHLYYGRKIRLPQGATIDALVEKQAFAPGNTNVYNDANKHLTLEDLRLEMSSYGKGDIGEPFIEVVHSDGSYTSDFLFEKAEIRQGKRESDLMPVAYDETGTVTELCITLSDKAYNLFLEIYYSVFAECDVITRSERISCKW